MGSQSKAFRKGKSARKKNSGANLRQQVIQSTSMASYYGARPVSTKLQLINYVFSSGTGPTSFGYGMSFGNVASGSARFSTAFDEYRILDAKVTLIPLTSANGFTAFFWSERQLSALTANTVNDRMCKNIANSNGAGTNYHMTWKADAFQDLDWQSITAPISTAWFYMYTDNTFGTPAAIAPLWNVQVECTVQFRGISSV